MNIGHPTFILPSIWGMINTTDKRIYIRSSNNTAYGIFTLIKEMGYRVKTLPSIVIQDYWDGKLSPIVLGPTTSDLVLMEVDKKIYSDLYKSMGYTVVGYPPNNHFIAFEPTSYYSLDGVEHYSILVKLRRKQATGKKLVVGVFKTMSEAKAWAKYYYPEYDKRAVATVVVANNKSTRDYFTNPVLQDPSLIESIKKLL